MTLWDFLDKHPGYGVGYTVLFFFGIGMLMNIVKDWTK